MTDTETNITKLYRIENPNIPARPDGVTSHEDLVGQWFSPDLNYVGNYLRKATHTRGTVVDGAQLVVAEVQTDQLASLAAQSHPTASSMDIEPGNYIIPRDGTFPIEVIPIDEVVGELRGGLSRLDKLIEAKRRIAVHMGSAAFQ